MPSEKKELIRLAAIKVISSEGFFYATTDKIAVKAGISVGTIYNYFKNKEDILGYIFEVEMNKRVKFWNKMEADVSVHEKLTKYVQFHFEEISQDLDLANVLIREHNFPHKHVIASVENFKEKISTLLIEMLKRGKDEGEIHNFKNMEIIAAAIFGALQGASQQFIKQLEQKTENKKIITKNKSREVVEMLWKSLKK